MTDLHSRVRIKRRTIVVWRTAKGRRAQSDLLHDDDAQAEIDDIRTKEAEMGCKLLYLVRCSPRKRK